eukprot:m.15221 g.15221  ORF g.15221 m.15221 type:complete len:1238 (+) comp26248_c0_seq1:24-3737(+)
MDKSSKMTILSVHPDTEVAQCAYTALEMAAKDLSVKVKVERLPFESLNKSETTALDRFYNADVVFADLSESEHRAPLFYQLGVRESFDMHHNVITFHDRDPDETLDLLKISSTSHKFVPYSRSNDGTCIATELLAADVPAALGGSPSGIQLVKRLRRLLQAMDMTSRKRNKEFFLNSLRKAREKMKGEELKEELRRLQKMIDADPLLCSSDSVVQLLLTYRDIKDYEAMVNLVEKLPDDEQTRKAAVQHHYAFALNRRQQAGDRDKALDVLNKVLQKKENHVPDLLCLCGRIYKDKFTESNYKETEWLQKAIQWYRKGFEVQPNVYAGINLATLLVVAGEQFHKSRELQTIINTLHNLLGRKGSLESQTDYWDVATYFEISVLSDDYEKACKAAECMFKINPLPWCVDSTLNNIKLINKATKQEEANLAMDQVGFEFWLDFFTESTKEGDSNEVRFPVLVLEPNKVYIPSSLFVSLASENKSVQLSHTAWPDDLEKARHEWHFPADSIKNVSLYKREDRCLFLYVQENSDDFQLYFPSKQLRQRCFELLLGLLERSPADQDELEHETEFQFEYEWDENERKVLGRGTYGIVYSGFHVATKQRLAIKEVQEKDSSNVQPLHEEIHLHRQLRHDNIVQYMGSRSEDGYFKIFMEQVPGGSLSSLLRKHWGPLKNDEKTISHYTRQIARGLKYLHDQKIVHRDIKGDNVLVNTYSGVLKISDFGTSKRLAGINPNSASFAGTMQFMAPEVIDAGQRGYGMKADIWSLGCTVIEMATGFPPFHELGSPQAALFRVGMFKAHPEIPKEMSETAESFLKRCFDPLPDKRASAAELLEHLFLVKKRQKGAPRPSLTGLQGDASLVRCLSTPTQGFLPQSPPPRRRGGTLGGTLNLKTNTLGLGVESPDSAVSSTASSVFPFASSLSDDAASDPFEQLQSHARRKAQLTSMLTEDKEKICSRWEQRIAQNSNGRCPFPKEKLLQLQDSFQAFFEERKDQALKKTVQQLVDDFHGNATATNGLNLALVVFQEVASEGLKNRGMKPHHIFAIDNLVKEAISRALGVLTPDIDRDFENNVEAMSYTTEEGLEDLTIKVPDKRIWQQRSNENAADNSQCLRSTIENLSEENFRLMRELLEVHKALKQQLLSNLTQQKRLLSEQSSPTTLSADGDDGRARPLPDSDLVEWLRQLALPDEVVQKFVEEEFSCKDVLECITYEDLAQLKLKGGARCRIWAAVCSHRRKTKEA